MSGIKCSAGAIAPAFSLLLPASKHHISAGWLVCCLCRLQRGTRGIGRWVHTARGGQARVHAARRGFGCSAGLSTRRARF